MPAKRAGLASDAVELEDGQGAQGVVADTAGLAAGVNDGVGAGSRRHAHQELAGEGRRDGGLADGLKLVLNGKGVIAGQPLKVEVQLVKGLPLEGEGLFSLRV